MAKLQSGTTVYGNLIVNSNITLGGGIYTTTGLYWAANNNVISTGGGGSAAVGASGQMQYNNGGLLGAAPLLYYPAGNSAIVANSGVSSTSTTTGALVVVGGAGVSGAVYAGSLYDNGNRVMTSFSSSGAGNLTVSVSNPASTTISLPATGPGAASVGSSTAIPVITTDAYGRVSATSTAAVVAPAGTLSGSTLASGVTASSLTSVGNIATGTWSASFGAVSGANLTSLTAGNLSGTIPSAVLGNSTHYIGTTAITLNRASASQALTGITSIDGSAATVTTAAQPNITSVGTLTGLTVSGAVSITDATASTSTTTGALKVTGGISSQAAIYNGGVHISTGNIVAASTTASTTTTTGALVVAGGVGIGGNVVQSGWHLPSANVTYNLGSTTAWWNMFYGKSVQAQYADLAENYTADSVYEPGTVVVFGGSAEITTTTVSHDSRVAGVISTNPAYLMNAIVDGLPVAMTGRVPCKVQGPVAKGTVLVTSTISGVAQAIDNLKFIPGCVLGKALESINTNSIDTIEVVVGRF